MVLLQKLINKTVQFLYYYKKMCYGLNIIRYEPNINHYR